MAGFHVGGTESDHVVVTILGRSHPTTTDYWDGNWVTSGVEAKAGSFAGRFTADLRVDELVAFRRQLVTLYEKLSGRASLASIERWLELDLDGDGRGHIAVSARLQESLGPWPAVLEFHLELDQTDLPPLIDQLREAEDAFPLLGRESGNEAR